MDFVHKIHIYGQETFKHKFLLPVWASFLHFSVYCGSVLTRPL